MQRQLINILFRIQFTLRKVIYLATVVGMMTLSLVMFLGVVDRYVLHFGWTWGSEISRYIFVWVSLLGATIVVEKEALLRIDLINLILPPRLNFFLSIIFKYVTLFFLSCVIFYGIALVMRTVDQTSPTLEIPMCFIYLAVPLNASLMVFFIIISILKKNKVTINLSS